MSRTKRFIAVSAIPVLMALVLSTVSVTMAGASTDPVPQPPAASTPVPQPPKKGASLGTFTPAEIAAFHAPQQLAYSHLNQFLQANPTTNAGLTSNGAFHITVHLLANSQLSPALAALIAAARAIGVEVVTDVQTRSLADLAALMDRACQSTIFATVKRSSCSIDPGKNRVQIGVTSVTPALVAAVAAKFGNTVVVVQHGVIQNYGRLDAPVLMAGKHKA